MLNEIKRAFSENKFVICVCTAILIISLILGYYLEPYCYEYLNPVVEDLTQKVQSGVITITFQDIFSNNARIILQMFLYGILFCISTLILAFNGFFVGYYVAFSDDLLRTILYIVPHGIFEFSSCILACSAGCILFKFFAGFIRQYLQDDNDLKQAFNSTVIKLEQAVIIFLISVFLMIIAGFIEAYLTIPIADVFLSILG